MPPRAAALLALLVASGPALAQVPGLGVPPAPAEAVQPAAGPAAEPALPTPSGSAQPAGEGAASAGDAYGLFQRGYYLSALRAAEPLANMGDATAQTLLGEIYGRGLGVPRDEAESARWYGVAAKAGVPEAQFRYAMILIEGRAVPRDDAAARDLMKAAADAGNPLASFNYAQMLIQASPTGGFAEALAYVHRAADAGVADAQYALSQFYAYGRGVAVADDAKAREWLEKAARAGHDTAQIEVGIWLINGRGGPADAPEGFRWLKGAAERGNPIAANRLAHLYKDGIGASTNRAEAARWAVIARRAANSDAQLDSFFRALPEADQKAALEAANRTPAS